MTGVQTCALPIFDDLRRKIDDVTGDLPDGVDGPYVNDEFGDVFGRDRKSVV